MFVIGRGSSYLMQRYTRCSTFVLGICVLLPAIINSGPGMSKVRAQWRSAARSSHTKDAERKYVKSIPDWVPDWQARYRLPEVPCRAVVAVTLAAFEAVYRTIGWPQIEVDEPGWDAGCLESYLQDSPKFPQPIARLVSAYAYPTDPLWWRFQSSFKSNDPYSLGSPARLPINYRSVSPLWGVVGTLAVNLLTSLQSLLEEQVPKCTAVESIAGATPEKPLVYIDLSIPAQQYVHEGATDLNWLTEKIKSALVGQKPPVLTILMGAHASPYIFKNFVKDISYYQTVESVRGDGRKDSGEAIMEQVQYECVGVVYQENDRPLLATLHSSEKPGQFAIWASIADVRGCMRMERKRTVYTSQLGRARKGSCEEFSFAPSLLLMRARTPA